MEYEAKSDIYYYGKIPKDIDEKKLIDIMADALYKYYTELHKVESIVDTKYIKAYSGDIMDRWFEHDANGKDKFDHLIPEEEFEKFTNDVVKRVLLKYKPKESKEKESKVKEETEEIKKDKIYTIIHTCLDGDYLPNSSAYNFRSSRDKKKLFEIMKTEVIKQLTWLSKNFKVEKEIKKKLKTINWDKDFEIKQNVDDTDEEDNEDTNDKILGLTFSKCRFEANIFINNDDNMNHWSSWTYAIQLLEIE